MVEVGNEGKYFIYSVSYCEVVQMIDLFIINIHSILLIEHTIKTGHYVGSGFHKCITQSWSLQGIYDLMYVRYG